MADPKTAQYAVFEGIKAGNRFFSRNCPDEDQTKLVDGTVAYRILGYADTEDEAHDIMEGSNPAGYVEMQRRAREIEHREMFGDNIPPEIQQFAELETAMLAQEVAKRQVKKALTLAGYSDTVQADNEETPQQTAIEPDGYKPTMGSMFEKLMGKKKEKPPCLASIIQKLNAPAARLLLAMGTTTLTRRLSAMNVSRKKA